MKPTIKLTLMLLLCLTSAVSFSQVEKTEVFSEYPETISISKSQLTQALTATEGTDVTLSFSAGLAISGKVVANVQKYDNLQSMVIKSESFANALIHLSKITNKDNSISYVGRVLSDDALDAYEIKNETAGVYHLKKIQLDTILQLCTQ